MKTIILTLSTPAIANHCKAFADNKSDYARQFEFDYFCGNSTHHSKNHPAWYKINLINNFINDYDFVIWADMDLAFMNFKTNAVSLLPEQFWMGACKEFFYEFSQLCSCYMVIRSNDISKSFFKQIQEISQKVNGYQHPWEQKYINEILYTNEYKGIKLWYPDEIGGGWPANTDEGYIGGTSYHNGEIRGWKQGELILHLGGAGSNGDIPYPWREREFIQKYQPQIIY